MIRNISFSLLTAFALSTAAAGGARADSSTNDEIQTLEEGNPHSIYFDERTEEKATNEQINSGETGNPNSVDYKDRLSKPLQTTNAEINAAELESNE